MGARIGSVRRRLEFETVEQRNAPSVGGAGLFVPIVAAQKSGHGHASVPLSYSVTLRLTSTVTVPDRASGFVKVKFSPNGSTATVFGSLSKISNVSAIVLHLTAQEAVPGSTSGQTATILLKPGSGSGPIHHTTFEVPIDRFSLIGPLVAKPLSQLRAAMAENRIIVVIQTTNGIDPTSSSTPGALQPGNYPAGELVGIFEPTSHGRV
jgi:hypothetical protein